MDSDPLGALADIHLPEEVGFWPLAPGWWLVLAVLLGLAIWGLVVLGRRLHRLRLRHAAVTELEHCRARLQSAADTETARIDFLSEVNAVLRRVALAHYPRNTVAGLTGREWLEFLRSHGDLKALDEQSARALSEGRFAPHCQYDPDTVYHAALHWIHSQYLSRIDTRQPSGKTAVHHA